jgi:hypothetical protein
LKKIFSVIIAIIIIVISIFYLFNHMKKSRYPSMPDIEVTYNQQNIETVSGLCNWFDKDTGGNSWFPKESDPEKLVENLNSISVKKEDSVNFVFQTSYKQPTKTTVYLIVPNKENPYNFSMINQPSNDNYFNVPKEKGEYIFFIDGYWDDTHNVEYCFRINVE